MEYNFFDIFAADAALTLAVVLTFLKMPGGEQWRAMRRMNTMLIVCYAAMGISNISTSLLGANDPGGPETCAAMLIVSMYQAMLFTATCVVFVSPKKISGLWLTVNALAIAAVGGVMSYGFVAGNGFRDVTMWFGIAVYVAQLLYYCRLFYTCFNDGLRRLEESFDEDMRGSLRLVKHCFLGALAVGISALIYVVFRLGHIWYEVFTCIDTLYYIYLIFFYYLQLIGIKRIKNLMVYSWRTN